MDDRNRDNMRATSLTSTRGVSVTTNRSRSSDSLGISVSRIQATIDSRRRYSSTARRIFEKIFHDPTENFLTDIFFSRMHRVKVKVGQSDSKWMIHPYSHFK